MFLVVHLLSKMCITMPVPLLSKGVNKKIIMKSLVQSVLPLHRRTAQFGTKPKNHYDTLGVPVTATYSEIKTAYYDLTFKYHPDKNKTDSAKLKFQEISDAYDVLGKYESRRRYDKFLSIKHRQKSSFKYKKDHEPNEMVYTHLDTIYNFDEWVKKHYTEAFEKNQEKIRQQREYKGKMVRDSDQVFSFVTVTVIITFIFTISLGKNIFGSHKKNLDKDK